MGLTKKLNYYLLSDISPTLAVKISYYRAFKKKLDLNNVVTLNEKVNWLKLNEYVDNEKITMCADKYLVREYVEKKSPGILNKLYGVWDNPKDISWELLPNKFAIKLNHGAGYNFICTDKHQLDIDQLESKLLEWKQEDFWKFHAEMQYKPIKKKIIIEEFIETENGSLPNDYKIYCFHGEPKYIMSCEDRNKEKIKFYYFTVEGELIPFSEDSKKAIENKEKVDIPSNFPEMINIAKQLSSDFKFVRVDLYSEKNKVIFGELTFSPGAGLDTERLEEVDLLLGESLNIKESIV